MPRRRIAAPTNTTHSVCVRTDSAITGRPQAATSGHHDPPGTWMGAGGVAGGSRIGSWCSVFQRGSRLVTVGMTEKLYTGGGDGMLHSSVAPPHGSFEAACPCPRVRHTLKRNTRIDTPIRNAPTVETRFRDPTPSSDE